MIIHEVSSGETLYSIAQKYHLTPEYLQNINQLPNPNNLALGQTILILYPKIIHQVVIGDSLSSIAAQYRTSVIELLRNNPYLGCRPPKEGQLLVITYEDVPLKDIEVIGCADAHTDSNVLCALLPYLTYLSISTYGIHNDFSLIDIDDSEMIALALSYGVAPIMHLSTLSSSGVFSSTLASQILHSTAIQEILIANIVGVLTEKKYYGINVAFEFVAPEDQIFFIAFIKNLKDALNPLGFLVFTSLGAKTHNTPEDMLAFCPFYDCIGQATNLAFVMTYESEYTYGPPVAIASIQNIRSVLNYVTREIPSEKIFMNTPSYGYLWKLPYQSGVTRGIPINITDAIMLASDKKATIEFDSMTLTPYFYFKDNQDASYIVWFEDCRSTAAKLGLVDEYELIGSGYLHLDDLYPQNWMILNTMYHITQIPVVISAQK